MLGDNASNNCASGLVLCISRLMMLSLSFLTAILIISHTYQTKMFIRVQLMKSASGSSWFGIRVSLVEGDNEEISFKDLLHKTFKSVHI